MFNLSFILIKYQHMNYCLLPHLTVKPINLTYIHTCILSTREKNQKNEKLCSLDLLCLSVTILYIKHVFYMQEVYL